MTVGCVLASPTCWYPCARRRQCGCAVPPLGDPHIRDDPIFIVVGVERTLRLLVVWRALTDASGLITAIAAKRSVGAWAPRLGVFLCADLGVVIVPKPMLLWASSRILTCL